MRFEIKSGGVAAILVGIAALSGAVFMLGLLAGYDVGRESQSSAAQVATAYPVAAPPAGGANGAAAAAVAAAPRPMSSTEAPDAEPSPEAIAVTKPVSARHPKAAAHAIEEEDEPPSERAAAEMPPSAGEVRASRSRTDAADNDEDTPDAGAAPIAARRAAIPAARATPSATAMASANPAHAANQRHRPYNIQIEAAMDSAGANAMVQRLQTLGYRSHLVPAHLNGQTWYKVVIGPYPTQEAAAAAQSEMRAKYNNTYSGIAAGAGAPKSGD